MVQLSIQLEGNLDLTWPLWKRHVREVEELGFPGLYRSDHFAVPEPEYRDVLELIVSLTYLADHTRHVHFGPCVAPLSYRDPVTLAFQAAALDDLSEGRMILGVGAGWMEREHTMFGYDLGDIKTRMDRLEEGLEVITRLLCSREPVMYSGRFYRLRDAAIRPLPGRAGGPPIMIGGRGVRRTLPMVARYAQIWNVNLVTPEEFRERSAILDNLLRAAGRQPGEVKRTLLTPILCGRSDAELERTAALFRPRIPGGEDMSLGDLLYGIQTQFRAIIGNPDEVVEQIRDYERVGVQEVIAQFYDQTDFQLLALLGQEVLPRLTP